MFVYTVLLWQEVVSTKLQKKTLLLAWWEARFSCGTQSACLVLAFSEDMYVPLNTRGLLLPALNSRSARM